MEQEDTRVRFKNIISTVNMYDYILFGCGAIGSNTGIELARMGAEKVLLVDQDKVSSENVGVSAYTVEDIGKPKTQMLKNKMLQINPQMDIAEIDWTMDEDNLPLIPNPEKTIMVFGFDSMSGRKMLAEKYIGMPLYGIVDARMGSEVLQVYNFKSPKLKTYIKHWYPDDEASQEPCSSKATPYCSTMSGSIVANTIKRMIKDEPSPVEFIFDFKKLFATCSE